ncbi:Unknown protein sequence [Pseudomonas coronafaciens pv. oryzae]|nr:Unknown protein sequence [Pseudomonas coronafaciens pv. oryzae]
MDEQPARLMIKASTSHERLAPAAPSIKESDNMLTHFN